MEMAQTLLKMAEQPWEPSLLPNPITFPKQALTNLANRGDGVMLTVLKPETMTFTRSTRIQLSDIAVGQIVSTNITLESSGRGRCVTF